MPHSRFQTRSLVRLALVSSTALFLLAGMPLRAQSSSSSSSKSSSSKPNATMQNGGNKADPPKIAPRMAQVDLSGNEITLQNSEPLFDLMVAKNVCGYDADLDRSLPVRAAVRADVQRALSEDSHAPAAKDALCAYISKHTLGDRNADLKQYISLSLYVGPAPGLALTAPETNLPPDATQVLNVLGPLRTFAEAISLHVIWERHRTEYEDQISALRDVLTKMIVSVNVYLHLPVSSYDGRRFLVILEPMIAPATTNAFAYGTDTAVIASPGLTAPGAPAGSQVHLDDIRHSYLRYAIEPLVYARSGAMARLQPLLKTVTEAPIDFDYKSDITLFITENLVKSVEARTMDVGIPKPKTLESGRPRTEQLKYDEAMTVYDRQAESKRQFQLNQDLSSGWVLARFFYDYLALMEKDNEGLKENVGEMVYGMDVDTQIRNARKIVFTRGPSSKVLIARQPSQLTPLEQAEDMLSHGNTDAAEDLAQKALDDPKADHAAAHYLFARAALMDRLPSEAELQFQQVLQGTQDPRMLAWSHVYLGRLYDTEETPEREKAVTQYRAALALEDCPPDARAAAERGVKEVFSNPKRPAAQDPDAALDPSGKAAKAAYKPTPAPQ